jgi:hypothetical protein
MQRVKTAGKQTKWKHSRHKFPRRIKTAMSSPQRNSIQGDDQRAGFTNPYQSLSILKWECRRDWSHRLAIIDISYIQKFETFSKVIFS